jgi:small conductance mechanosensitive channel
MMEEFLGKFSAWLDPELVRTTLMSWGFKVIAALAIFVIGRWVAKILVKWLGKVLHRAEVDSTLSGFLSSIVYIALIAAVLLTALGALGVNTTSFLALVGAAGLAIGLALKDSLGNFAAGVMLIFFRPFKAGDYVEAGGTSGTVEAVRIFNTVLKTPDNRIIIVPNSLVYSDVITNYSDQENRRIDLVIGIGYNDSIPQARGLIEGVLQAEERVLDDPAPTIMVLELGSSSVYIAVRPWVKSADYWTTRGDLLEHIKVTLEDNGLTIPYPQTDVHLFNESQVA